MQPAARAGAILRAAIAAGKFHGVTSSATPTGWCSTMILLAPAGRDLDVAADPDRLLGVPAEELGRVEHLAPGVGEGLAVLGGDQQRQLVGPVDHQLVGPPQDLRALAGRRRGPLRRRPRRPRRRRRSRRRRCRWPPRPGTSPVAGSRTSNVAPSEAARWMPPMISPVGTAGHYTGDSRGRIGERGHRYSLWFATSASYSTRASCVLSRSESPTPAIPPGPRSAKPALGVDLHIDHHGVVDAGRLRERLLQLLRGGRGQHVGAIAGRVRGQVDGDHVVGELAVVAAGR